MTVRVPMADLGAVYRCYQEEFDDAVARVLSSGHYILGDEVAAFEAEFAGTIGASHATAVASGTDALELALRAAGVATGDTVVTVSHTAVATVAAIRRAGATVRLVDIDPDTYTMSPAALESALRQLDPVAAVVVVHLYGAPADMVAITDLCRTSGAVVIEDAAQAHGATAAGRPVGTWGAAGAFSFYPTKNLGAFGDAGAVVTQDTALAEQVLELRQYGWRERVSQREGTNSRMDELQAAILRVRLRHLAEETAHRRAIAHLYDEALAGHPITLPKTPDRPTPDEAVYHQYVVALPAGARDQVRAAMAADGIDTAVHYPEPVHQQPAYRHLVDDATALPHTDEACRRIMSLPIGLHVDEGRAEQVALSLARALDSTSRA